MRRLATYSLNALLSPDSNGAAEAEKAVGDWLRSKGAAGDELLSLPDGRVATLNHDVFQGGDGTLDEWELFEDVRPGDDVVGAFETKVSLARTAKEIAISITLASQAKAQAPIPTDAYCPRLVSEKLLPMSLQWTRSGQRVPRGVRVVSDDDGAEAFVRDLLSAHRVFPVVALSHDKGFMIADNLDELVAADLCAQAEVVRLSENASWTLTNTLGRNLSCFGGAVRIYWPRMHEDVNPFHHPLFYYRVGRAMSLGDFANWVRTNVRRRVLTQSAFGVSEPDLITRIRTSVVRDRDGEVELLRRERDALLKERDELKQRLLEAQRTIEEGFVGNDEAETQKGQGSLIEAVTQAAEDFKDSLIFGADVWTGVAQINPVACRPDRLTQHLAGLARLRRKLRPDGGFGGGIIPLLQAEGIDCDPESNSIKKNAIANGIRNWDDGAGGTRMFLNHTRPTDATAPDRCIRIYFDWDSGKKKFIIGWIGTKEHLPS